MISSVFDWLDIFDSCGAENIEICHREKFNVDGVRQYTLPQTARAVNIVRRSTQSDDTTHLTLVWLIPGSTPEVSAGDLLRHAGKSYEISQVEQCRSMDGTVIARRCTVL